MHLVSCGSCDICFQVHLQASNRKWEACDQWPLEDMGYHTGANVYGQRGQTLYTVVKSVLMFFLIACNRNPCTYVKVCQTDLVFISLLFQLLQRKHIITAVSLTRQTKKYRKNCFCFLRRCHNCTQAHTDYTLMATVFYNHVTFVKFEKMAIGNLIPKSIYLYD